MARWSRFAPAADRRLVRGLHDGDDDTLAALYDVYAERLYDYCMTIMDDSKAAADVVHDTFIDAARRAPRMRERALLRPWLYAAARRRCMQRNQRSEPEEGDPTGKLDFVHREALFLALRHDLDGDELAATLGVSSRRAQKRLKRAERLVPEAAEYLDKAPAPVLPSILRHRVQHTGTDPELAGYRAEIAARGGSLTPDGMPRQPDAPSPLARRWAFASAGSLAALGTALVALMIIGPDLPVPEIQWPGGRPHRPSSHPTHRDHTPSDQDGGAPGRTLPDQNPGTSPTATPLPPGSPSPTGPGMLAVTPQVIHLTSRESMAELYLAAKNGSVKWAGGSSNRTLKLSKSHGGIHDTDRVTIRLTLQRGLLTLAGRSVVTLTDDTGHDVMVNVAWDASLL